MSNLVSRTVPTPHLSLIIAILSALMGCGPKQSADPNRTTVSGAISFDGKPLPAGSILFTSANGSIASTAKIAEGTYTTDRAPLGENLVSIDTSSIKYGNPAKYVPIPAKYADSATSGLNIDVQSGVNENVNFDLKP